MKKVLSLVFAVSITLIPLLFIYSCEQPAAKADGPSQPACIFDGYPEHIFCTGQFGEKCFICYEAEGQQECWPFDRSKCYHP